MHKLFQIHSSGISLTGELGQGVMDTWIAFIAGLSEDQVIKNPQILLDLFSFDLNNPWVSAIQSSLSKSSEKEIAGKVKGYDILKGDWTHFTAFVQSYATWCALIDPERPDQCFESYAKCLQALQLAYSDSRGGCLNLVVRRLVNLVMSLFSQRPKLYQKWIAGVLQKFLNSVRSGVPNEAMSKKDNSLFFANYLSRLYFKMNQIVTAGSLYSNLHNVGIETKNYSMSEQVEYHYWVGRHALYQIDISKAYEELTEALNICLYPCKQYNVILEWLVVPAILMGKLPTPETMAMLPVESHHAVSTLSLIVRSGNISLKSSLYADPWIQSRYLRPVLDQIVQELAYKRCIKRILIGFPESKIPFSLVRTLFNIEDPDFVLTESIVEMIISKGMKGKVIPKDRCLFVKQSDRPLIADKSINN